MTKVFIGGSRHVSRLDERVRERLDTILSKGFPIVVGDADGADRAVQVYCSDREYPNVEVFCSDGVCRNNVGSWPVRDVPARAQKRDAEFYSAKDRVMAEEATVGLMVWDGKSVGTLANIGRLLRNGKRAVLFDVPSKTFVEFRSQSDWDDFVLRRDPNLRRKLVERLRSDSPPARAVPLQGSLLDRDQSAR